MKTTIVTLRTTTFILIEQVNTNNNLDFSLAGAHSQVPGLSSSQTAQTALETTCLCDVGFLLLLIDDDDEDDDDYENPAYLRKAAVEMLL